MRDSVLVWIGPLYLPTKEHQNPRRVVWFVNQHTGRDLWLNLPLDDTGMARVVLEL